MPRQIFSLTLLIICVLGLNYSSKTSTGKNSLEENFQRRAVQGSDLSGTYLGMLQYAEAGFSGVATLTIDGNKFTLRGEGLDLSGTLRAIQSGGRSFAIRMSINSTAKSARKVLSLTLTGEDRRISIRTLPNDSAKFVFSAGDPNSGGRDPASDNSNAIATNANANTATNANVPTRNGHGNTSTNANIATRPNNLNARIESVPAATPPTNANSRKPNIGQIPKINAKATSAMPPQQPVTFGTGTDEPALFTQVRAGAHAVFTTPSTMRFEETTDIELVLSPTKSVAELESELTERGESKSATTEYSNLMEAQLVSAGFDVVPLGPSIQPVEASRTTRWKWQIKPKAGGAQELKLTLNAVLADGKNRIYLQTLKRDIKVNVKLTQRAAGWLSSLKDLHWLWAALLLPIGTAIVAWWRRKKRKPKARKKKSTKSAAGKPSQP